MTVTFGSHQITGGEKHMRGLKLQVGLEVPQTRQKSGQVANGTLPFGRLLTELCIKDATQHRENDRE